MANPYRFVCEGEYVGFRKNEKNPDRGGYHTFLIGGMTEVTFAGQYELAENIPAGTPCRVTGHLVRRSFGDKSYEVSVPTKIERATGAK
jgi:hypothetical protein